jgi:hypothetical protein
MSLQGRGLATPGIHTPLQRAKPHDIVHRKGARKNLEASLLALLNFVLVPSCRIGLFNEILVVRAGLCLLP